ncbi:hypothetical protein Tco_1427345 [Tanacetum coccineum]
MRRRIRINEKPGGCYLRVEFGFGKPDDVCKGGDGELSWPEVFNRCLVGRDMDAWGGWYPSPMVYMSVVSGGGINRLDSFRWKTGSQQVRALPILRNWLASVDSLDLVLLSGDGGATGLVAGVRRLSLKGTWY